MTRLFSRLILTTFMGVLILFLNLITLSIVGIARQLPNILRLLRLLIQEFLLYSFRFYKIILGYINSIVHSRFKINLLTGWRRIVCCISISLVLEIVLVLLISSQISWITVVISIIHGFVVGTQWSRLEEPNGIRLGERI